MEVKDLLPEGYNAPCIFLVTAKTLEISGDISPDLLNGFQDDREDLLDHIDVSFKKNIKSVEPITYLWNRPDSSLYTTTKGIANSSLTEEEFAELGDEIVKQWHEVNTTVEVGEMEGTIVAWHEDQEWSINLIPIQLPRDYFFLGSLFDTPAKQLMYEDFITEPIIYDRLVKKCRDKGLEVKEEMTTSASLPVHAVDKNTGEILISTEVLKMFDQYQFAQNYLRGFVPGTAENDMGKLLMLDPKFCDYMITRAERASEGKELNEENYMDQLGRAIIRVNDTPKLLKLYENDLIHPSEEGKSE